MTTLGREAAPQGWSVTLIWQAAFYSLRPFAYQEFRLDLTL
jgi:hypothetical protein